MYKIYFTSITYTKLKINYILLKQTYNNFGIIYKYIFYKNLHTETNKFKCKFIFCKT